MVDDAGDFGLRGVGDGDAGAVALGVGLEWTAGCWHRGGHLAAVLRDDADKVAVVLRLPFHMLNVQPARNGPLAGKQAHKLAVSQAHRPQLHKGTHGMHDCVVYCVVAPVIVVLGG